MNERMSGRLIVIGAILFGIATVFHPPLSDPWDVSFAYKEVAEDHDWIIDHIVFLGGLTFWLIGLASLSGISRQKGFAASRIIITSLGMWYLILAVELSVLPQMIQSITVMGQVVYQPIWNVLFTLTLFSGYIATGFIYMGLLFLSASYEDHVFLKWAGLFTAAIGVFGVIGSLVFPKYALWLQLSTAPLPYLWTFWLAKFHLQKTERLTP